MSGFLLEVLYIAELWSGEVGLWVNPEKTDLVVFTWTRKLPGFSESHTFGITLCYSESAKYFGVILDSRLTWRKQVKAGVKKIHNLLWACTRSSVATRGLNPKVVHWLYVYIFRPSIISFTSLVTWLWDSQCQKETHYNFKTCLFGEHAHYHSRGHGSTNLPLSTWFVGPGRGKVSCTSTLQPGGLVLLSIQSRKQRLTKIGFCI